MLLIIYLFGFLMQRYVIDIALLCFSLSKHYGTKILVFCIYVESLGTCSHGYLPSWP